MRPVLFDMVIQLIEFNHSTNNITYSSQDAYMKKLIRQSEKVFQRLHNNAYFKCVVDFNNSEKRQTYGFKSHYKANDTEIMAPFEAEWWELVKNVQFRDKKALKKDKFQTDLKKEVNKMTKGEHLITKSDKTNNLYKVNALEYDKIIEREVCMHYRKCAETDVKIIESDIEKYSEILGIKNRVTKLVRSECFITLKDHKDEWPRISKFILDKILKSIKRQKLYLNQFTSTDAALNWFTNLQDDYSGILSFDINSFYPSITERTLNKALDFAGTVYSFEENEREIIMCARKSILFFRGVPWCTYDREGCP